jgi:hypothetical protein
MQAFHRNLPGLALAAALLAAPAVHAQAVDPAKQKLVDELLGEIHPEAAVVATAQMPAAKALEQSRIALQTNHVPKDKADKTLADIGADAQKYVDAVTPLANASAKKNVGAAGALIAQNFSNDELKELIAIYKSNAKARFEKMAPQIESAIGQKVEADVGPQITRNIKTLTESVGLKLRAAVTVN